ncbi:MAG: hypothetical protein QM751_05055 [Paludibacteraceae bacterium]
MKKIALIVLSLMIFVGVKADEGMWMLPLMRKTQHQNNAGMGSRSQPMKFTVIKM